MTLIEIASSINQNLRFKMSPSQISSIISQVQIQMFNEDLNAFLVNSTLPLYTEVPCLESGFTVVNADIGTVVTQATSGFTGTLRGYFNDTTNSRWSLVIERDGSSDDWNAANYAITNTLSLAATSDSTKVQADASDFKGPYNYPTDIPCRKMWGVSLVTDPQIYSGGFIYVSDRDDYGEIVNQYDERRFLLPATKDAFARTITLINAPNLTSTTSNYRFWYWRKPESITDFTSEQSKLIVDEAYHDDLIQMAILSAKIKTRDGNYTQQDVKQLCQGWWKRLREEYEPMGKNSNQVSDGNWP